ncbi:DUF1329 domain-containing protein [Aromatoleum buckelii]|uniref:DUF1329 domain-containing protein n=1 Tax=Aromatoleum buckelii TaxID=200254 RepID=A0ABX1N6Z7_9RHOO|nr:DUF1329 domain-containing protein [Aromatoleum buckelii]MCK0511303.1 DUF1329 domain-containing protein [Aromatoleum buckelii]
MTRTTIKPPRLGLICLAVAALIGSSVVQAAASDAEAAALGKNLTPIGAEAAANQDGSIPAWTGGMTKAPAGWKPGHLDPFKDDKPLYSIDASNVDKYADKLSAGQVALIKAYQGYRMDVYPSRRSCPVPDFVAEQTKKNATAAKLGGDGWQLEKVFGAGIPFPIPKTGAEAMWNFKLRYTGLGRRAQIAALMPEKDGSYVENKQWAYEMYPFNDPKVTGPADVGSVEAKLLYDVLTPPSRAGEGYLVHTYVDKPQDAWIYFPGQRRVRRSPTFAYDNQVAGFDNLYFVDQINMFTGALDRYDYKLVGKKEMFVPYNSYKLIDKSQKFKDMLGPEYVDRDLIRYEPHRVWVVEATVKPDKRHSFAKRVFHFDEDSWALLQVDMYDAKGNLWRVQEGSLWAAPEVGACITYETQMYDLVARRYVVDNWTAEGEVLDLTAAKDGRITAANFTQDEMRRRGER